ncbi:hypothetical protein F9U64_16260 [Gracilibacillus oryzae]|uniref:Uncharacterized protein n=1 Tax=Gracilibacillus oryzae TaxID=1672701 RepID=A0A7C8KR10_9BACI|nr:hypothetical protein [Gracilibacillus oryzae]KAB8128484.1 hypothetical protein F9U64_16260 [Gracilibacillus oryzae]
MSSIIKRRKTANYTQINNMPIQEDIMDLGAIGLLVYIMSLPESWELHKSQLHNHFTRRKVDSSWKVLVEKRYIIGFYCHVNGKKRYYYNVSDIPFTQDDYEQFILDVKDELESEENTVYNIEKIKDSPLDIPELLSIVQNEQ